MASGRKKPARPAIDSFGKQASVATSDRKRGPESFVLCEWHGEWRGERGRENLFWKF